MVNAPENEPVFQVVLNDDQQYSIWPLSRALPAGWHAEGTKGSQAACLERIEAVWTDMRPLSVRRADAGAAAGV